MAKINDDIIMTDKENETNKESKIPKKVFEGGQVGIKNLGNTCYMSSALQCLFHTEELVEYFFSKDYKTDLFNYSKSNGREKNAISPDNYKSTFNLYGVDNNSNTDDYNITNNNCIDTNNNNIIVSNFRDAENHYDNKANSSLLCGNNENFSNEVNIELDLNISSTNINNVENNYRNGNYNSSGNNNNTVIENGIARDSCDRKIELFNEKPKNSENENINCVEINKNNNLNNLDNDNSKDKNEKELKNTRSNNRDKSHFQFDDEDVIVLDSSESKEESGELCDNREIHESGKRKEKDIAMIIDDKIEPSVNIHSIEISENLINNHNNTNNKYEKNINEINKNNGFSNNETQEYKILNMLHDEEKKIETNKENRHEQNNSNFNIGENSPQETNFNKRIVTEENSILKKSQQTLDNPELNKLSGASQESFKTLPSIQIPFKHDDEKEKQLILFTQNFKDLIQKMWSKSAELINPKEFRESLICLNSQFNNYSQQDAHELLTFILESLHVKLNRGTVNSQSELNENNHFDKFLFNEEQQQNLNLNLNKTQSILNWENHVYFNDSVINDYFYGLLLSSLTCKKCGSTNVTYEPFNHLGLSIPNEFHLFIYFVPDFRRRNIDKNFFKKNNTTIDNQTNNFNGKSYGEEMKVEEENKFEKSKLKNNQCDFSNDIHDIDNNNNNYKNCFNSSNDHRKKNFPKAIKMYIKINDNMQFKNIIDTVSERLNYPIENGVFYGVIDNEIIRVIESDERCGELMQRNFFLFLAETMKQEKISTEDYYNLNNNYATDKNKNQINNNKNNCNEKNGNNNDTEMKIIQDERREKESLDIDNLNNYNNHGEKFSLDLGLQFFVNFNFFSFPKGKFNAKQKANPISYPRIMNYPDTGNKFLLFFILCDLIKYSELIFQKKIEKDNEPNDLENSGLKKLSSRYSNDSSSENVNYNNKKRKGENINLTNSKNKKSNELNNKTNNKRNRGSNEPSSNKTEERCNYSDDKFYSFLDEISKTKNFIFCNKAVLLEESNTYFNLENTQEKYQLNNNNVINNNINNYRTKTNVSERTNSRIKSSLLRNSNTKESNNNSHSFQGFNQDPINISLKNKFICLFCASVDSNFFYCDCLSEFLIKNQIHFEAENSLILQNTFTSSKTNKKAENDEKPQGSNAFPITNKSNNNVISNDLDLTSFDFCKIKKNFLQNFLVYSKQNETTKKTSSELLAEICLFTQEDLAKDSFRLLNACKDLTTLQQKETLITLNDLLDYFTAEEKLREEKFFCLTCNDWISRVKRLEINKFPNILIINFKRFRYDIIQPKGRSTRRALESSTNSFNFYGGNNSNLIFGGEKNENKIDFPFDLDLTKFNRYGESTKYELYAVCNHEGKISGGHYKAVCRDFQSNKWFEFDDKIVKQINQNTIVSHKAYILFYRRKKD